MTAAEELIAEGLEKGLIKGQADLLSKQLALKFGQLPLDVAQRLANANVSQLEVWAERVLFCTSLDDVFAGSH